MQKAYIEHKTFHVGSEADKHLSHIQRISTDRDLPKNEDGTPRIKIFGAGDGACFLDVSCITNQPAPLQRHKRKKAVSFMEVMTYVKNDDELKKISEYLSDKYKRPVFACRHDDEGVHAGNEALDSHVHILLPWRGQDGRALRMNRTDLKTNRKEIAELLNAELTPAGMGQRRLRQREYMALQKNGELEERKETIESVRDAKVKYIRQTGIDISDYIALHKLGQLSREHYETEEAFQEAREKGAALIPVPVSPAPTAPQVTTMTTIPAPASPIEEKKVDPVLKKHLKPISLVNVMDTFQKFVKAAQTEKAEKVEALEQYAEGSVLGLMKEAGKDSYDALDKVRKKIAAVKNPTLEHSKPKKGTTGTGTTGTGTSGTGSISPGR